MTRPAPPRDDLIPLAAGSGTHGEATGGVIPGETADDLIPIVPAVRLSPGVRALFVGLRVAGVIILVSFAPGAGVVALVGLVAYVLVRTRVETTTIIAVYALALLLVPSRYTLGVYAVTVAMLVGFVASVLWVYDRLLHGRRHLGRQPRVRFAVEAFFFANLASYIVMNLGRTPAVELQSADRNLVVTMVLFGVFLALADGVPTLEGIRRVLGTLVVGGAVIAVVGMMQHLWRVDVGAFLRPPAFTVEGTDTFIYQRAGLSRVAGTARHPIEFGVSCALIMPLCAYFVAHARGRVTRLASGATAVALMFALLFALSRSALLAVAVAALVMLPTWSRTQRAQMVGGTLGVLVLLRLTFPMVMATLGDLIAGSAGTPSVNSRRNAIDLGLDLWARRPIFGHGIGAELRLPVIVDNQYIVTLVESGIVGLVTFVGVGVAGVLTARRIRRATADPQIRDLAQALVAMMATTAVAGFGLNVLRFPMTAGLFFIAAGCLAALARVTSEPVTVREDAGDVAGEPPERMATAPVPAVR